MFLCFNINKQWIQCVVIIDNHELDHNMTQFKIMEQAGLSPGAGGDLVAMKGPQGFSFFFINYMVNINNPMKCDFTFLKSPGEVLVKKHSKPPGPLMATGS